jgi:transmembrane sensor
MEGRDFRASLGEADAALERAGVAAAVDRRLRERLTGSREGQLRWIQGAVRPRRRLLWPLVAAGVLTAATAIVFVQLRAPAAPAVAGGLLVEGASGDLALAGDAADGAPVEILRGTCTLVDRSLGSTVGVSGPARLVKEAGALRVVRGRVHVAVAKRVAGQPPARLLVSGGAIEVRGTRFTIEQGEADGRVTLHDGAIRFVARDGRTVDLAPGESLAWPLPAATIAPSVPSLTRAPDAPRPRATARTPALATPEPVEELLGRIAVLRSRTRFEEAVGELERALQAGYPAVVRERLSFEVGSLLTHQIGDPARGCAHWRLHARIFGAGRYDREVAQARETLRCPPSR